MSDKWDNYLANRKKGNSAIHQLLNYVRKPVAMSWGDESSDDDYTADNKDDEDEDKSFGGEDAVPLDIDDEEWANNFIRDHVKQPKPKLPVAEIGKSFGEAHEIHISVPDDKHVLGQVPSPKSSQSSSKSSPTSSEFHTPESSRSASPIPDDASSRKKFDESLAASKAYVPPVSTPVDAEKAKKEAEFDERMKHWDTLLSYSKPYEPLPGDDPQISEKLARFSKEESERRAQTSTSQASTDFVESFRKHQPLPEPKKPAVKFEVDKSESDDDMPRLKPRKASERIKEAAVKKSSKEKEGESDDDMPRLKPQKASERIKEAAVKKSSKENEEPKTQVKVKAAKSKEKEEDSDSAALTRYEQRYTKLSQAKDAPLQSLVEKDKLIEKAMERIAQISGGDKSKLVPNFKTKPGMKAMVKASSVLTRLRGERRALEIKLRDA